MHMAWINVTELLIFREPGRGACIRPIARDIDDQRRASWPSHSGESAGEDRQAAQLFARCRGGRRESDDTVMGAHGPPPDLRR